MLRRPLPASNFAQGFFVMLQLSRRLRKQGAIFSETRPPIATLDHTRFQCRRLLFPGRNFTEPSTNCIRLVVALDPQEDDGRFSL